MDLKLLKIIGHGAHNQSCHESPRPNLCSKLQKYSACDNGENKEINLIKTMLADKIKHLLGSGNA